MNLYNLNTLELEILKSIHNIYIPDRKKDFQIKYVINHNSSESKKLTDSFY